MPITAAYDFDILDRIGHMLWLLGCVCSMRGGLRLDSRELMLIGAGALFYRRPHSRERCWPRKLNGTPTLTLYASTPSFNPLPWVTSLLKWPPVGDNGTTRSKEEPFIVKLNNQVPPPPPHTAFPYANAPVPPRTPPLSFTRSPNEVHVCWVADSWRERSHFCSYLQTLRLI